MSYMEGQLMTMASSFSSPTSKPFLPTPKSLLNPIPNRLIFNPKPAFGDLINRAKRTAINVGGNNLHFPIEETRESFYCLLGVSEGATLLEIKKAYKQLVLKYHPDVSPLESAQEFTRTFIRIQEAYETLSDPTTRALYDTDFTYGFHIAFSPEKACHSRPPPQGIDKRRWQVQLEELERKSRNKNWKEDESWAARVRMQGMGSSI